MYLENKTIQGFYIKDWKKKQHFGMALMLQDINQSLFRVTGGKLFLNCSIFCTFIEAAGTDHNQRQDTGLDGSLFSSTMAIPMFQTNNSTYNCLTGLPDHRYCFCPWLDNQLV